MSSNTGETAKTAIALKDEEYQVTGDRTDKMIAAEIVAIREQTSGTLQAIAVSAAVQIGKRLQEAKSLVPYGSWRSWLKNNLDYSERTAQNLMKLAEENDKGGLAPLLNLSYSKAVQLIGLPAYEREEFMEVNDDVEKMSTRDLKAAVKRYRDENEGLQLKLENIKVNRKDGLSASQAEDLKVQLEKAKDDAKSAVQTAQGKDKTIERLEEDLKKANDKAGQVQMKDAAALAKAKAEVPEAAQKELDELRENERKRKAAEDEAVAAMAREGAEYTFRALYDQFKNDFERMIEALGAIGDAKQQKYRDATLKALETMKEQATPNK